MRIAFPTAGMAGMFTVDLGLFGTAAVVWVFKVNTPSMLVPPRRPRKALARCDCGTECLVRRCPHPSRTTAACDP